MAYQKHGLKPGLLCIAFLLIQVASAYTLESRSASPSKTVRRYLSAKDRETALSLLAPDYRLWFEKREGDGIPKKNVARMLEWDFALNPRHKVLNLRASDPEVIVSTLETNDFSRLIGFPGWMATSTFTVNESGKISSQVYVSKEGQPDWKPYLEKALPWLREHHPDVLTRIYAGNRSKQTAETAVEWVKVLREWRVATNQSDPTKHK